jgi:dihydroorotase
LPLLLMAVKRNLLTLKRFIDLTSSNPARIFGLRKGMIALGYDADLIIVGETQEIRKEKMHSKSKWTPYNGMRGVFPRITLSRGDVVFEDGELIAKRGHGRFVPGHGLITGHEPEKDRESNIP